MASMTFPKTEVNRFLASRKLTQPGQRVGQAFYNHFNLHKCTQDKVWADQLFQLDGMDALKHIEPRVDYDN